MAATVREVILKLRMQMDNQRIKLPAPDTSAFSNSLAKARDEFQAEYINMDRQAAAARSQFEITHQGGKKSPTETGTNSEIVGKLRISADAYKVAGEGALHLGRGLAFLTAAGEDELQVVLRRIAYYQGLYDVVRGGLDLTKGAVVGTRALVAAHTAAAAATAAHARFAVGHAAALTTSTVVMNAASAAATRMWAALMGPIGWAALAAGVAYGAAKWIAYRQAVEDAAIEQHRLLKEHATLASIAKGRQDDLNRATEMGTQLAERAGVWSQIHDFKQGLITSDVRTPLGLTADARRQFEIEAQGNIFKQKQALLAEQMGMQQASTRRHLESFPKASSVLSVQSVKTEIELHKARTAGEEAMNGFLGKRLALLGEELRSEKGIAAEERKRHDAQRAMLKEEEDRKKSLVQRFGELKPWEQQRQLAISEKVKKTGFESLRPDELEIARQGGFANAGLDLEFFKKGKAAGADKLLSNFGDGLPGLVGVPEGQRPDQTNAEFIKAMMKTSEEKIKTQDALVDKLAAAEKAVADEFEKAIERLSLARGANTRKLIEKVEMLIAEEAKHGNEINNLGRNAQLGQLARSLQ